MSSVWASVLSANANETLTQTISRCLEEEILSGHLRPRERLVETELASRFGASRAPVREALGMLEREGLVSKGSRGVQVAEVSLEEAREIFEVLADLEELYTCRATPLLGKDGVNRMKVVIAEMDEAVVEENLRRYFDLNEEFHGVLRSACPNRTLIRLLGSLGKKTQRFRRMAMSLPGRLRRSFNEHVEILEAVEAGDAVSAGRHARASAERAYLELLDFLKNAPGYV